jgi:hypothetical protein
MSVHPEHSGSGCAHAKAPPTGVRTDLGTAHLPEPAKRYAEQDFYMSLSNLWREKFARGVAVAQPYRKATLAAGFSRRSAGCLGATWSGIAARRDPFLS